MYKSYCKACRTLFSTLPARFFPFHFSELKTSMLCIETPTPHTRSKGFASTSSVWFVLTRHILSSSFWLNLAYMVEYMQSWDTCFQSFELNPCIRPPICFASAAVVASNIRWAAWWSLKCNAFLYMKHCSALLYFLWVVLC